MLILLPLFAIFLAQVFIVRVVPFLNVQLEVALILAYHALAVTFLAQVVLLKVILKSVFHILSVVPLGVPFQPTPLLLSFDALFFFSLFLLGVYVLFPLDALFTHLSP